MVQNVSRLLNAFGIRTKCSKAPAMELNSACNYTSCYEGVVEQTGLHF